MMTDSGSFDDFARLRLKRAGLVVPDPERFGGGVPAFVGRVTSTGPKIAVGDFLLVQPTFVLGSESEGGTGSLTSVPTDPVPVYLVGPGTPSTGDFLVCRFVDHRWAAERSKSGNQRGGYGTIPNCFCTAIPAALTMTSSDPTCNYRMFQSCMIQYGPTPAQFAPLNLGPNIFLSTESFADPVAGGAEFFYYLACQYNQFSLTRLYPASPFGSPYRDGILYTWLVGGYGNTCSPFHLDNGMAFPGSDLSCSVTIDSM
jgi:hypothetical protein